MFHNAFGYGQWIAIVVLMFFAVRYAWIGWRRPPYPKSARTFSLILVALAIILIVVLYHDAKPDKNEIPEDSSNDSGYYTDSNSSIC